MDKFKDFPEAPRHMTAEEGRHYFEVMLEHIRDFEPEEIVAVNRSGFSYAMWAAQRLALPLGVYWPQTQQLAVNADSRRLVFVDDNVMQGHTYLAAKAHLDSQLTQCHWRWAVLFTDWNTPEAVREQVIHGVRLPYFADEPFWGSAKVSTSPGRRFRDG